MKLSDLEPGTVVIRTQNIVRIGMVTKENRLHDLAGDTKLVDDLEWIPDIDTWSVLPAEDLILYTHLPYKTKSFFEVLENPKNIDGALARARARRVTQ